MHKSPQGNGKLKQYAACSTEELMHKLSTSIDGLGANGIEHSRDQYGSNRLRGPRDNSPIYRFYRAFLNPFHLILLVLALVSLVSDVLLASDFSRNATTAVIMFLMIFASGTIRLIQEFRAKRAAAQLDRLIHRKVSVKRGGQWMELHTRAVYRPVSGRVVYRVHVEPNSGHPHDTHSQAALLSKSRICPRHTVDCCRNDGAHRNSLYAVGRHTGVRRPSRTVFPLSCPMYRALYVVGDQYQKSLCAPLWPAVVRRYDDELERTLAQPVGNHRVFGR